jgi:hypothetical protein
MITDQTGGCQTILIILHFPVIVLRYLGLQSNHRALFELMLIPATQHYDPSEKFRLLAISAV